MSSIGLPNGIFYTGVGGGGLAGTIAPGTTRWNATTNMMEMFNGYQWSAVSPGAVYQETLAESVLHVQDQIGSYIEEDHKDNVTIQDAYQVWVEATEKFRVVLAMAEKK